MFLFVILCLVMVMGFPTVAFGRPEGYEYATCYGGGEDEDDDICQLKESNTRWECNVNLTDTGEEEPLGTQVWAVYDQTGLVCDQKDYCAWGLDQTGEKFFCAETASTINTVAVVGNDKDDVLQFWYNHTYYCYEIMDYLTVELNLDTYDDDTDVFGEMLANGGQDILEGSRVDNSWDPDYWDKLHAGGGDDDIRGRDGNDYLWGEADDDTIWGYSGKDYVYGGDGDDWIRGGSGDDELKGDMGDDMIAGEDGDDTIWGNGGKDFLCGDDDSDTIRGDANDDWLWAGDDEAGSEELYGVTEDIQDHCQQGDGITNYGCEHLIPDMPRPDDEDECPDLSIPEPDEE